MSKDMLIKELKRLELHVCCGYEEAHTFEETEAVIKLSSIESYITNRIKELELE